MNTLIYTKALAERIKPHLPIIINTDQSGFVRSRYIGKSIRTIEDILAYSTRYRCPGISMAIDFEKAFDKIRQEFIFKALEKFGFGDRYISWVKILYKDLVACVMNNGYTSDGLNLHAVPDKDVVCHHFYLL